MSDFEGSSLFMLLGERARLVNTPHPARTNTHTAGASAGGRRRNKKGRRAEILIEIQPLQLILTAVNQGCCSAAVVPGVKNRRGACGGGAGGGEKGSDECFPFFYLQMTGLM